MNKRICIFLAFASLGLFAFTSCESDDEQLTFVESASGIIETALPEEGQVLETITFNVKHLGSSGCASYARTETLHDAFDIFVTYYQQIPAEATCTDNIITLNTAYVFVPPAVGEYTFHFKQSNSDYLEQKITITE